VDKVEGAVLVDHLKSVDWTMRKAAFHSKADPALLKKVRGYVAVVRNSVMEGVRPSLRDRMGAPLSSAITLPQT
jgi:hypothetical protein